MPGLTAFDISKRCSTANFHLEIFLKRSFISYIAFLYRPPPTILWLLWFYVRCLVPILYYMI